MYMAGPYSIIGEMEREGRAERREKEGKWSKGGEELFT